MARKNKEQYNHYMAEYMLKRYHERREYIFSQLGNECNRCGSSERLEVDHIDRMTKAFSIAKMWSVKWESFAAEVNKCQVLCHECHVQKSIDCGDFGSRKRMVEGSSPSVST